VSAREHAVGALLVLQASILKDEEDFINFCRVRSVDCLRALQADGETGAWLRVGIADIGDLSTPAWQVEHVVADGLVAIEELMVAETMAEMLAARTSVPPASRPASPPPRSERGDEMAAELRAARASTGDTLPPSGEVEFGEMACCGADTDPPAPGSVQWWDDTPTVRC
jgi:hypothetical protein